MEYTSVLMKIMENNKESEHGSTLMTPQPFVNNLTHLLHPFFPAIYGHLWKEKEDQQFKGEMKKGYDEYRKKFIEQIEKKLSTKESMGEQK